MSEGHQEIMSDKKPEPEPTKQELEAEFDPEDKGKSLFFLISSIGIVTLFKVFRIQIGWSSSNIE